MEGQVNSSDSKHEIDVEFSDAISEDNSDKDMPDTEKESVSECVPPPLEPSMVNIEFPLRDVIETRVSKIHDHLVETFKLMSRHPRSPSSPIRKSFDI